MYEEEFEYWEPKETDLYVEKLQSLIDDIKFDVKGDIKDKIDGYDKLREKYDDLYEEKQSLSNDLRLVKKSLDEELKKVELDFKKRKFEEYFGDLIITVYKTNLIYEHLPKCDLCDEFKKIEVVLPSGKKRKVDCECNEFIKKYVVQEGKLIGVEFKDGIKRWLSYSTDNDTFSINLKDDKVLKTFDKSINKNGYGVFYESKEEAQKHADYLNSENN